MHPRPGGPAVAGLRKLLGNDVLLLPWPPGCKGTRRRWGHFTLAKMEDAKFLRRLEQGNIGVALGSNSGGVCSIDLDSNAWVDTFLAANPALQRSLRTRGARGCNLWVRCAGIYRQPAISSPMEARMWVSGGLPVVRQLSVGSIHPAASIP